MKKLVESVALELKTSVGEWRAAWGLPEPKYELTGSSLVLTIYKNATQPAKGNSPDCDTVRDTVKDTVKSGDLLAEIEVAILTAMRREPDITAVRLSAKIGINTRNVKKRIANLKQRDLIRRMGSDKKGTWEVR